MRSILFGVFLLALAFVVSAQTSRATQSIDGVVVDFKTGAPIRGVVITAAGSAIADRRTANTDDEGHFEISRLLPDRYSLFAQKDGYSNMPYGTGSQPLPKLTVTVAADAAATQAVIRLRAAGVLAGRVLDDRGKPMRGVEIRALEVVGSGNRQRLVRFGNSAMSDDRGEFRVFWLNPGKYVVEVNARRDTFLNSGPHVPANPQETYLTTYFPSTTDVSRAIAVDVDSGENRVNDIHIVSGRTPIIHGVAVSSVPALQFPNLTVILTPTLQLASPPTYQISTGINATPDNFEIRGATPGRYELAVRSGPFATPLAAGRTVIDLSNSDLDVQAPLVPTATIQGLVSFSGVNNPGLSNVRVRLEPDPPSGFAQIKDAALKADGTFVLEGVIATHYRVSLNGALGGYLASVKAGAEELLSSGIDLQANLSGLRLEVRGDGGIVSGVVRDASGAAQAQTNVLLIPQPESPAHVEPALVEMSDQAGGFEIRNIRPGKYILVALPDIDPLDLYDPTLPRIYQNQGTAVEVKANDRRKLELRRATDGG